MMKLCWNSGKTNVSVNTYVNKGVIITGYVHVFPVCLHCCLQFHMNRSNWGHFHEMKWTYVALYFLFS